MGEASLARGREELRAAMKVPPNPRRKGDDDIRPFRSERDPDGLGRALAGAVVDELDVVACRVQDEGGVVAGVIGALSGAAVVYPARRRRGRMQAIDGGAVLGLKCQVDAAGRLA